MALLETTVPYEALFRWDEKTGALRGAHVVMSKVIRDGDVIKSVTQGDALPVALAGGAGFPLADILSELQVAAVVRADEAADELAAATQELDALRTAAMENSKAISEKDQRIASLEALVASIAPPQSGSSTISSLAFLNRFTSDERAAIRAAAQQNATFADWLMMVGAARDIDLADAAVVAGIDALIASGLLLASRKASILAP